MIDFTSDMMYVVAIYNPSPGIEGRLTSMIDERDSLVNLQSIRPSDELAVVSFLQNGLAADSSTFRHEWDLGEIEEEMVINDTDHVICYRESKARILLNEDDLESLGRSAIGEVHQYKYDSLDNIMLPERNTYHLLKSIGQQVSDETPKSTEQPPAESYEVEFILPISRIVTGRTLVKMRKDTGIIAGEYLGAPATSPYFSEAATRILIRRITEYIRSLDE